MPFLSTLSSSLCSFQSLFSPGLCVFAFICVLSMISLPLISSVSVFSLCSCIWLPLICPSLLDRRSPVLTQAGSVTLRTKSNCFGTPIPAVWPRVIPRYPCTLQWFLRKAHRSHPRPRERQRKARSERSFVGLPSCWTVAHVRLSSNKCLACYAWLWKIQVCEVREYFWSSVAIPPVLILAD